MTTSTSPAPADGERRALAGYTPQFTLAARLLIQALASRSLDWVKVADPEAGSLDDFQVATAGRLDAYQVKWASNPGTVTYNDLTEPKRAGRSGALQSGLVRQLADGWKQLREANPGRRVVVHLVCNGHPTPNRASLPVGEPAPRENHLAGFFNQGWAEFRAGADTTSGPWHTTLEAMREATGLSPAEFRDFAQNCEFVFGETTSAVIGVDRADEDRVRQYLQDVVANPARRVQLTTDELLDRLGWRARVEFRNRHEFPDPTHYVAIPATPAELEARLAALCSGYLAVVGSPGSGKSTLLTQVFRGRRDEYVLRYYAFVPDDQDPGRSRGEAVNFFHDVCLAARRAGIVGGGLQPEPFDLPGLRAQFGRVLQALGRHFRESGRRAIILIDGLDHIARELRPNRSLLAELPIPGELPDGVFVVFGTQTEDLPDLPPAIRATLDVDGRRIAIAPLSRAAVVDVAEHTLAPQSLSAEQADRVHDLSDGHPLALTYLLVVLRDVGPNGFDELLKAEDRFPGRIETVYATHAREILATPDASAVLAAACRMRTAPNTDTLACWYGTRAVHAAAAAVRRYLQPDARGTWRFFHNSFRQYLMQETSRNLLTRELDPSMNRRMHAEIADRCAGEPNGSPLKVDELYHRVQAEDNGWVCQTATAGYFRSQLLAGRTLNAVQTDTRLALRIGRCAPRCLGLRTARVRRGRVGEARFPSRRVRPAGAPDATRRDDPGG